MDVPSLSLKPFTDAAHSTLELVSSLRHRGDLIEFEFILSGSSRDLERVRWPQAQPLARRQRRDELGKTTCLELFLAPESSESYVEMNLSPSGDWNLYLFDRYREGMTPLEGAEVLLHVTPTHEQPYVRLVGAIRLNSESEIAGWLKLPALVFGVTAVLEYQSGEREYWALHHAGEKPDFHLRSSFTGRLAKEST